VLAAARAADQRLRWRLDDEGTTSPDKAAIARIFTYLYGLGATLVLVTLPLANLSGHAALRVEASTAAAYAATVLLLVRFDRLPYWVFLAFPPLGTVLITNAILAAGPSVATVYATLYFWVVLAAASFFSVRIWLANLVWIGASYAFALTTMSGVANPTMRWSVVIGTLAVVGIVIEAMRRRSERLVAVLRRRARKQASVAALGRKAVLGAGLAELSAEAVELVAEGLGVEYAAVFGALPGGKLEFRWGHGLRPQSLETPASDPLIGRALRSESPVIESCYGDYLSSQPGTRNALGITSGVAVAIPGIEEPIGVLAACSRPGLAFTQTDAAFLEAVAHIVGDATERARAAAEREHRALHDPLTDRPNRALFTDRLGEALIRSHREQKQLAVYFLDIDDFKLVNDSFGHAVGDELLKAFAARLREGLVMTDTVARFGGDEFAILCENLRNEVDATGIAERIRRSLEEPFVIGGAPYRISASIGVALSGGSDDADGLVAHADAAMYRAKERSRGGYEFFDHAMRERVRMRLGYETALRSAIADGGLKLAVQPIVSLPDGEPIGSEALLRWHHPDLGQVPPDEFIPIAEKSGAILAIGEWVLREAAELTTAWRADPALRRLLPLHVNVSARQLVQHEFTESAEEVVVLAGADPADLAFEVTEHALLDGGVATATTLARLKESGFAIVLDDFGTGYSSLSNLKQFPIDAVKIDRMFISRLTEEKGDEAIVSAVLGIAYAFGIEVVAEGIETSRQVERLAALGCRRGQGYYFARPGPVEGLRAAARASSRVP
jgi:diguanylate cyclase (GGDEF)-like protein